MKLSQLFLKLSFLTIISLLLTTQVVSRATSLLQGTAGATVAKQPSPVSTIRATADTTLPTISPVPGRWEGKGSYGEGKGNLTISFEITEDGKQITGIAYSHSAIGGGGTTIDKLGNKYDIQEGKFSLNLFTLGGSLQSFRLDLEGKFVSPTTLEGTGTSEIDKATFEWSARSVTADSTLEGTAATLQPTAMPTSTAPASSVPTSTKSVTSFVPKSGFWEGTRGVSFEITSNNNKVHKFRIEVSHVVNPLSDCILTANVDFVVEPNNTFFFPKGNTAQNEHIRGSFTSATSMTGSYKLPCGPTVVGYATGSFSATWKR